MITDVWVGYGGPHQYGRWSNPTRDGLLVRSGNSGIKEMAGAAFPF